MAKQEKAKTENGKPTRTYLYWDDGPIIQWKLDKEYEGRKNWGDRWGPGNPWWKRYSQWICSDMRRAMRKPSFRSLEWLVYDQKAETPATGEQRTRRRSRLKDYFMEPLDNYHCCPTPSWPITTAAEIGWLAKNESCQLEIYGNKYMQKPPLPWYMPKISTYLSNSQ